jgi:glutamate-1-semialdehyde 2,1-aminomutase
VFGKAIANGYPLGAIGGKAAIMDLFDAPKPTERVMISGTYNGHPLAMAAAIGTMETLLEGEDRIYANLENLGGMLETGLKELMAKFAITATVVRQGSAFCVYFMDHAPIDWHDIAGNHDMAKDVRYRKALIERGIYNFPLATKQGSISDAHTVEDITETLKQTEAALSGGLG